jgi:hypothetical protein
MVRQFLGEIGQIVSAKVCAGAARAVEQRAAVAKLGIQAVGLVELEVQTERLHYFRAAWVRIPPEMIIAGAPRGLDRG